MKKPNVRVNCTTFASVTESISAGPPSPVAQEVCREDTQRLGVDFEARILSTTIEEQGVCDSNHLPHA